MSALLELANAVAQTRCFLVGFLADRLYQLRLGLLVRLSPGLFAAVTRFSVNVFQKRYQLLAKLLVIVGTAQAARVPKFDELDAALRTFFLVESAGLVAFRSDLAFAVLVSALLRLVKIL